MKCEVCGKEIEVTARPEHCVCEECNQKILQRIANKKKNNDIDTSHIKNNIEEKEYIFCINCGKKLSYNAKFCDECGTKIIKQEKISKEEQLHANISNKSTKTIERNVKKKKKTSLISIIFLVIILFVIITGVSENQRYERRKANKELLEYYSISFEEADELLKDLGFTNYVLKRDDSGDNLPEIDTLCFSITENNVTTELGSKETIQADLYIKNDSIYLITYEGNELYANGEKKHKYTDYILTYDDRINIVTQVENEINSMLKSPSTAKYPTPSDWYVSKFDGEYTIRSYVDSQNGFGAMIRSNFELKIKDNTITYFVFDGKQYK